MLPTEVRSRIYDYVFGSTCVRVISYLETDQKSWRAGYKISTCSSQEQHTQLSPRIRGYERDSSWPVTVYKTICQGCAPVLTREASAHKTLSLPALQVSRQIYHEAVLKPFQQACFVFGCDEYIAPGHGIQAFLNALVPAHARTITHVRVPPFGPGYLLPMMTGLKHLDIQLFLPFSNLDLITEQLEDFAACVVLAEHNLKTQFILILGLKGRILGRESWQRLGGEPSSRLLKTMPGSLRSI